MLIDSANATSRSSPLITILIGMGGAGKTQLALEYCQRMEDSRELRAIFWLDASSRNTLYSSMESVAKQLLPDRVFDNRDASVASVIDVLKSWSERWLLVFDNLDNPEDLAGIHNFFPTSRYGSILITSRLAGSKELGPSIELDKMEKEEGLQLLLRSSAVDADELDAAEQILNLLGDLPLAIDQARGYVSKRQLRLRTFLTEYERRKQSVMQETPRVWQYRRMLLDKAKETSLCLLTTWEMSLQLLCVGEQGAELEKVITLFAFFNPVNIGERLFSDNAETTSPMSIFRDDGGHWNHLKYEDVVVNMQELSLLQFSHRNESEITVSLHSMVSEWLRMRLDESLQPTFLSTAVSHLKCYLNYPPHRDYRIRQEGQAHLDTIWRGVESFNLGDHFLEARIIFGNFYHDQDRLGDAEIMYEGALGTFEEACGPEHISTLDTVMNLGLLYADQGRHEDAEMMYNRALTGFEKARGPEHSSTLTTVNALGNLYMNRGHLKDAEVMYNRALDGFEKAWGSEHTCTLNSLNDMGVLYAHQGRHKDAEMMYNCALAGYAKAHGPEHNSTLGTMNNLGNHYATQGRHKDGEMMFNRVLTDYEKAWGPEHTFTLHTFTLNTINNLGNLYRKQGRHKDAEMMFDRALTGYEKAWGPEHTFTLNTIKNLGNLYRDQGRHKDAEMMYNRALAGMEKVWGPEHKFTLNTISKLGSLYNTQGRHKDAELMYNRVRLAREKAPEPLPN